MTIKLESYDICKGCGRSNIVGKQGLCLMCYVNRNDKKLLELQKTARFAKGWLDRNKDHRQFEEALERYEGIVKQIHELGGNE